jgi:CDGSH-type Zn-finger protein
VRTLRCVNEPHTRSDRVEPVSPQPGPYEVEETPGPVAWCSCGRSRYQPYCDGSHAGTGFEPVIVDVPEPARVAWCGCKRTHMPPYCDRAACEPAPRTAGAPA